MADERQWGECGTEYLRLLHNGANVPSEPVLKPFFELSAAIKNATGMLPDKLKPTLHELYTFYATNSMTIKDILSSACAVLAKSILKDMEVIKCGMKKENQRFSLRLSSKVIQEYWEQLDKSSLKAELGLSAVRNTFIQESSGDKLQGLINELEKLETQLKEDGGVIEKIELEMNQIEEKIASLKCRISLLEKNTTNETMAKNEMRQELTQLKIQIPDYERVLLQHHNITTKQTRPVLFGLFNRSQDIVTDNGEATAKKNLDELNVRIKILETSMGNWSIGELEKSKTDAVNEVVVLEEQQKELQKENAPAVKKRMDLLAIKEKVCKKIEAVYEAAGTRNTASIKAIDNLAQSMKKASDSLRMAHGTMKEHIKRLSERPDSLMSSICSALSIIAMADGCLGTRQLNEIRERSLGC
ncbi:unnamed protein product [Didymodactylos carnosus]|uniref:Uncharacterized protein n=1 Tax=Didymodactylos carnosus TaxID=1234261 RepID=A0A814CDP5_9BILA|nr:unnamed protein product [Didymodactylos carnosus]CAF3718367.1 unnamed protein product [Didymodactylos carnosus]